MKQYYYLTSFFGEKYFIGYLYNDHKVNPLHIMLLKTRAYVKRYDERTKWMYFLIKGDDLLEKYNNILLYYYYLLLLY